LESPYFTSGESVIIQLVDDGEKGRMGEEEKRRD